MRYRKLGKTGLEVSEVGFGGIPIMRLTADEAVQVLRHALDRGVTFYDTANAYNDSEEKMGLAFAGQRDKVVIATKTMKRDAAGALAHLEQSLRSLRTDYIDLYQLHQVSQEQAWQMIAGPGGALEALVKAKQQGKIRHIGITSHSLPMAVKLIKTGLFATVQFPFNYIETAARDELFPIACDMGLGIIAMKPFAGGVIGSAALSFKFLRQYPEALPIPGYHSVASVDEICGLYDAPNVVLAEDIVAMNASREAVGKRFCRRCEYCQPCPQGVPITPAMAYPVIAARMSPAVAVGFSRLVMEQVPKCVACGDCLPRCPYELSIPEILKANYDLYRSHADAAERL